MPLLFSYILKVSFCLGAIYLFYYSILRPLTFFNWNRWYFLVGTGLCFFIPLIAVSGIWESMPEPIVIKYIPSIAAVRNTTFVRLEPVSNSYSMWDWLLLLIIGGYVLLFIRTLVQVFSLVRLRRKANLISNVGAKIYHINGHIQPFSFWNSVFINRTLHPEEDLLKIIRHELVHVRQAHTLDIIWMELVCILNWFNPFVWLLRQQVRQNLEFISDHQVLQSGTDKKHYQYLLLQVTGQPNFRLANQFNFSPLKNRIVMMNKIPSAKRHLAKFLLVVPLSAGLLFACREVKAQVPSENKNLVTHRHEGQNIILAEFQDGTQEKFDISTEVGKKAFMQAQKFFGDSYNPADVSRGWSEGFKTLLKRNPDIAQIKWRYDIDQLNKNDFPFIADRLYITLKSGVEKVYPIESKTDLAKVENELGKLPLFPPPPPTVSIVKY
ncbi:M56 family metallopeptidase [Adhaeribacter swui]|uniref:M56 family metallopeptidase n=1 Tax=Adhaeribacter swui TaxID=2086471 RepID=A0A7G7GEM0_9BACT|nr:M56 family metallopeptidase [Adhaeribacter swui]QNF35604.1 M56 family metallopeptidase [Adhaeribacter swui]